MALYVSCHYYSHLADEVCEEQVSGINLSKIPQQLVVELNTDIQMCQPLRSTDTACRW